MRGLLSNRSSDLKTALDGNTPAPPFRPAVGRRAVWNDP